MSSESTPSNLCSAALHFIRGYPQHDLTLRQLSLIGILADAPGPHQVKTLSEILNVAKPVVTRAIQSLEKQGIVTQSVSTKDRRVRYAELTIYGELLRAY